MKKTMLTATIIIILNTATFAPAFEAHRTNFNAENDLNAWSQWEVDGWVSKLRSIEVKDGMLVIEPKSSGWFEDLQGAHIYQEVRGDFMLTARIKVEGTNSPVPQTDFTLAGLFLRAPRDFTAETWEPGKENWMFLSTGTATPAGSPHYEVKTTMKSQSVLKILPGSTGWKQMRIVRSGHVFYLMARNEGKSEWTFLDEFIRPDLPQTLNIGLTAYADWNSTSKIYPDFETLNRKGPGIDKGDLRAHVDWIEIKPFVRPDSQLPVLASPNSEMLKALAAE